MKEKKKLPEGWRFVKIGDKRVFQIENGIWTGSTPPLQKTRVLRNTNFRNNGYLDFSDVAEIEIEKNKFERKRLIPNDILIEKSGGGPNTPVGRVVIFKGANGVDYGFSNFLARLRITTETISPEFVHIYLLYQHWSGKTEKIQTQTTNLRNLDFAKYKSIDIPLPLDKQIQEKIAANLNARLAQVARLRAAAQRQIEAAKALQNAVLREVFPWKEGEKLPEGWRWEKIDKLARVNTRRRRKQIGMGELVSFVPMEVVDDVSGTILKLLDRKYEGVNSGYTYFEEGDILFAKITPCMQNGKCAIVYGLKNGFGFGSTEFVVLTPENEIVGKWVHAFLRTKEFRSVAEAHFTGSAGQQRVPTDFIKNYMLPIHRDPLTIENAVQKIERKQQEALHLLHWAQTQLSAIEALPAAILREAFDFEE